MALLLLPIAVFWGDRDAGNWALGVTLLGAARWVASAALLTTLDLRSGEVEIISAIEPLAIVGIVLLYGSCYCAHRLFNLLLGHHESGDQSGSSARATQPADGGSEARLSL